MQLRDANGCLDAQIIAVEWITRRDNGCRLGFLLAENTDCSQIGPDAEIWVVADHSVEAVPILASADYIEVGRTAHELQVRHGWNARGYAAKQAAEALAEGKIQAHEFWRAVELHLTPRGSSS